MSTSVTRTIPGNFEHEDFLLLEVIPKIYLGDFHFNKLPDDYYELLWRTPDINQTTEQINISESRIAAFVHGWILRGDM